MKTLGNKIIKLQNDISDLENQFNQNNTELKDLKDLVDKNKEHYALLSLEPDNINVGTTKIEDQFFYVVLENAVTYSNGTKIYLLIGNPYTVTYNGFDLAVHWGKDYSQLEEKEDTSTNYRFLTFTDALKPGKWTAVDFVLPFIKSDDIKGIKVYLQTSEFALLTQ